MVFGCKAHVDDEVLRLAREGTLRVGIIGYWTTGEPVSIAGRYIGKGQYFWGHNIRFVSPVKGFFSKGLVTVPRDSEVSGLPLVR